MVVKIYILRTIQNLPIRVGQAWDFFSDPRNLRLITPAYMGFDILSGAEKPMYPGQIIQYIVTPVAGIKMKWVTEITHVKDEEYFIDEQRFGPYSLWHHTHFFRQIPGGVEIEDVVHYKLPLGLIGQWVHPLIVGPKLKEIFSFRREKLVELFGDFPGDEPQLNLKKDELWQE